MRSSALRHFGDERGAINLFVLFLLAVVGAVAYFGYAYMPHWMRNREVISAMNEAGYQGWRQDDFALREMILQRTDSIILVDDGQGEYPAIDETMVQVRRDSKNVYIDVAYEVPMQLPWTSRTREIRFDNHVRSNIENPIR